MKTKPTQQWWKKTERGFTLLETIIAILILGIAIGSLFELVAGGLISMRYSKDEIVATYLAQEALDHVRNTRDTAMINNSQLFSDWLSSYGACIGNTCYVDVAANTSYNLPPSPVSPCSGTCPLIDYRRSSPSYYGYKQFNPAGDWETTRFRRAISLTLPQGTTIADATSVEVKVVMTWTSGRTVRTRTMTTSLTKWPE